MKESKSSRYIMAIALAVIIVDGVFFEFSNFRHGWAVVWSMFGG